MAWCHATGAAITVGEQARVPKPLLTVPYKLQHKDMPTTSFERNGVDSLVPSTSSARILDESLHQVGLTIFSRKRIKKLSCCRILKRNRVFKQLSPEIVNFNFFTFWTTVVGNERVKETVTKFRIIRLPLMYYYTTKLYKINSVKIFNQQGHSEVKKVI
jgi:hypothetical protein